MKSCWCSCKKQSQKNSWSICISYGAKYSNCFSYLSIIAMLFPATSPYNSRVFQVQSPAYPLLRQQSFQTSASPLEAYIIAPGVSPESPLSLPSDFPFFLCLFLQPSLILFCRHIVRLHSLAVFLLFLIIGFYSVLLSTRRS